MTYQRNSRSLTTLLVVLAIWATLLAAWIWLDAALWIIAPIGFFTLPAVYDLTANPSAGTTLNPQTLGWHAGHANAEVALDQIAHIRLDTRLDMSVRATVALKTGRKIRLPFESTPPHRAFETALKDAGLKVERHHFTFIQ